MAHFRLAGGAIRLRYCARHPAACFVTGRGASEGGRKAAIDGDLLQVAEVLRLKWGRRMTKVFLPQLYPYLMASARTGLALIWKLVLVVELLGRSNGVVVAFDQIPCKSGWPSGVRG